MHLTISDSLQLSCCLIMIPEGSRCGHILNEPVQKGISSRKTVRWLREMELNYLSSAEGSDGFMMYG